MTLARVLFIGLALLVEVLYFGAAVSFEDAAVLLLAMVVVVVVANETDR